MTVSASPFASSRVQDDFLLELLFLVDPEPDTHLMWRANHRPDGEQPITEGWSEVARLIASVDGHFWPWTGIELFREKDLLRWIQVLGRRDEMLLEVAFAGETPRTVFRLAETSTRLMSLPKECQWWVRFMRSDEAMGCDEAYLVAHSFLATGVLPEGYSSRPVWNVDHRNP